MINAQQQYTTPDGRLTIAGLTLLGDMARRLAAAERRLAAMGEVAPATGGATEDDEARAAIAALIAAAG